jgi:hypothetical protein
MPQIVVATYREDVFEDNIRQQIFTDISALKGTVPDQSIYVINSYEYEQYVFTPGNKYILLIGRSISVYYNHDRYALSAVYEYSEPEIANIKAILDEDYGSADNYPGHAYTLSEDITTILDYTEFIFEVEVLSVQLEGRYAPITMYNCRVTGAYLGTPYQNDIEIIFFNDTVEEGKKYIVLLAETETVTRMHTLSSRNSVYTREEAFAVPELAEILSDSKTYLDWFVNQLQTT